MSKQVVYNFEDTLPLTPLDLHQFLFIDLQQIPQVLIANAIYSLYHKI